MAFTVQNDSGTTDDANAYIEVSYFKAYHKDRGNDLPSGTSGSDIQKAVVTATDYLDSRFTFVGEQGNVSQRTAWPRIDAQDRNEKVRFGIPWEVKEATADYALIALSQELNPTPERDDRGQKVVRKMEKVGPIEEETEYASGGVYTLPKYPKADRKLTNSGLALSGRILKRA